MRKRRNVIADVAAIAGLATLGYGLWLIWHPVMFVTVGALIVAAAVGSAK